MKLLLAFLLFSCSALAQNDAAIADAKAACGPDKIRFDLETTDFGHSVAVPETGKALVYVIGQDVSDARGIIARIGVNGNWIGAINGNSHLFFSVAPGENHLCANWQSIFAERSKRISLASVNAEAGKIYYFRMRLTNQGEHHPPMIDLDAINGDEGTYLVLTSHTSESHQKK